MGDTKNTSNSSGHTADEFATFFAKMSWKVDDVRQSTSSTALPDVAVTARHALNEWEHRNAGGRGKANRQRPEQELSAGRCSDMVS